MIPYNSFNYSKEIPFIKTYDKRLKECVEYANISAGFDIETTSTVYNGEKFAFMYEWTFGIEDPSYICYGRTWEEFLKLCNNLKSKYSLSENRRLIIYVHNLSFEFQFFRKYFEWVSVFASDERKPIKALTTLGIEFRDSYILSGYSLAKLAENLTSHKVKKMVGDLNYKLCRTSETPLTDQELGYCNNDVEIVLDYINEQIDQYGDITKLPLTNTGRVRTFVKNNCLHTSKTHKKDSKGKRSRYTELMHECSLTAPQYLMLKRAFQGGFTHASMKYSGYLLKDVFSIDFTSSYPFVMLSEKFPMSRPVPIDVRTVNFWELVDDENTGLLFDCKITGLHALNTYETYLSESKCQKLKGGIINNGRIFEAEELITTITDIDLKIIKKCYSYDSISITNCYKFYMSYLPKSFIESILTLYEKKTTLKGVEGKEVEYLVSKGMLNSCYGMCVTDIVKEENKYTTEWEKILVSESQLEEQIKKYNESKTRFLYYPWGVWVTAYARRNLWTGILNIGEDYVYSDTDSIKFLNYENHVSFIESYNKRVEYKLKKMCDFLHIDFNRCKPKTKKGVEKLIGVWDLEGNYEYFKTLGAKRYMYQQNGEIHITIAGLSKQNGVQYLKMTCKDNIDIFNHFTNNLYIPAEHTGKNTHTYIDEKQEGDITDYLGHTTHVISLSAVHLCEADFTLNIALQYNKFLTMLRQGYLFTGTKCI